MFSSSTLIVSTPTAPSRRAPSSPDTSLASIGLKPPRKVDTPPCSTSKLALECRRPRSRSRPGPALGGWWSLWSCELLCCGYQLLLCNKCSRNCCVVNGLCAAIASHDHGSGSPRTQRGGARRLARVPARPFDDAAPDQPRPRGGGPAAASLVRRARGAARCARRGACARSTWPSGCCSRTAGSAGWWTGSSTTGLVERVACPTDRRSLNVELTDEGAEMLERMWPVYARGIAEDFLPALGSNPCEIRQTLESIGRSATRRGRPRRTPPRRRER